MRVAPPEKLFRSGRVRALFPLLLGGALMALAAEARAQTSSDRALAEALFQEGRALMQSGDPARACAKFNESQRLEVALGTLLNLAACYEAVGKTASAWAEYARALALAERVGDRARATHAEQQQSRLNEVLARLTLHTDQARDGLRMAIDGKEVRSGWDTPLPLDPGVHQVRVWAPKRTTWEQRVVVRPGPSALTLHVPTLEPQATGGATPSAGARGTASNGESAALIEPASANGATSNGTSAASERATPNDTRETSGKTVADTHLIWTWASLGASALALATGTVATVKFHQQRAILREHCRGQYCDGIGLEADERARTSALVADVSFGAGALMLLVTGYLWYTTPSTPEPTVALNPVFTANSVLLSASGHY